MAVFAVWHHNGSSDRYRRWDLSAADFFPDDYTQVAEVSTNGPAVATRDAVFQLTNHIDHDWTTNDGVVPLVPQARSTSVGDVLEDMLTGTKWVVAPVGFAEVK